MNIPIYNTFEEKADFFNHIKIDTADVLDTHIKNLLMIENNCIFRGVHEAKYKLYTSVQREWITKGLGRHITLDFLVENLIRTIRQNKMLEKYFKSLNIYPNDLLYLSLLQHYGAPSPLLDFSLNIKFALFFATDNVMWSNSSNDNIEDYISVYYLDMDKCGMEIVKLDDFYNNSLT